MGCRSVTVKDRVSGCSETLHLSKGESSEVGITNTAGTAGLRKQVENGMADCFAILKRITRLKCVNSEIRLSAFSLKRVPSCRSHHRNHTRTELDHCSDPLGTESHNARLNKISDVK